MFNRNKSGQGLPIQTIVIFILALIVLGVVTWIFILRTQGNEEILSGCEVGGGKCITATSCSEDPSVGMKLFGECPENMICCLDKSVYSSKGETSEDAS